MSVFVRSQRKMKTILENKIFTQLIATSGAMMLVIQIGFVDGWTSPNIVRLTQVNSTVPMTLSEASWLASYFKLGRLLSVMLMPIFIDLTGSKKGALYTFVCFSIGWLITMAANSAILLYIARFVNGISSGLASGCFPIFLGEISTPSLRGTFTAAAGIGWPVGMLIGTIAETQFSPIVSCTLYMVLCFLGIVVFAWLPESPYQLVKKKEPTMARKSLVWYRGPSFTESEMNEIVEFVESTSRVTFSEKMKQLNSSSVRKAVILITLVFLCPQICGVFNVLFYMETILINSKSNIIEPSDVTIYANSILLICAIISVNSIDKLGRRILLVVSMSLMTVAYFGLGLHFFLLNNIKLDPKSLEVLPIVSIVILIISFSCAFGTLMNALVGELFPASLKSTAAMIATLASAFVGFISTTAFQPLMEAIGEIYVYWTYAFLMALFLPILLFLLPETKGKSLQEIQNVLNKK